MEDDAAGALAAIVTVTLAALPLPFGVITDGEKLHVARLGSPEQANEIGCSKPLATATFSVSCAAPPSLTVTPALLAVLMENPELVSVRAGDVEES